MMKYGEPFFGSIIIGAALGKQPGQWTSVGSEGWICDQYCDFLYSSIIYRLPLGHSFYSSEQFKQARKPDGLFSEHSDEQLQAQLCEIQSEIERRKLAKEEIIVLARKACADNYAHIHTKCKFIEGKRDDSTIMMVAERAVIAGMKFQKGREI